MQFFRALTFSTNKIVPSQPTQPKKIILACYACLRYWLAKVRYHGLSLSIVPRNRAFRVSKSICQKAALKGMSLIVPPMTAPLPKAPHLHPSLLEVTRYRALNPPKQLFLLVQNTFVCIRGRKLLLSLEGRCAGKQGRLAYCFTKRRLSITRWPVLLIQTASLAAVWRTVNLHLSV